MISLSEQQCFKLDRILDLFKLGDLVDIDYVLAVEPNERIANSLITVLVGRGFVSRLGDTEESFLPMAIRLQPHTQLFIDNGGFLQELNKEKSSSSKAQHITITATGNRHIINTGNNNTINVNHDSYKGDLDALRNRLSENAVSKDDINEISEIVVQEEPSDGNFGLRVKEWIGKMINKSLNGVWEVGLSAAGGILAEILNHYYGIN